MPSSYPLWKEWAIALNADYSARPKRATVTDESASSCWPGVRVARGGYTRDNGDPAKERPTLEGLASQWETPSVAVTAGTRNTRGGTRGNELLLSGQAAQSSAQWATPRTLSGGANSKRKERGAGGHDLQEQVQSWSTPRASDGEKGSPNQCFSAGGIPLPSQAANWPTPSVMLTGERTSPETFARRQAALKTKHAGRTGNGAGPDLAMVAKTWPTPAVRDVKGVNSRDHVTTNGTGSMHLDQLPNFVEHVFLPSQSSYPDPATRDGPLCSTPALSLYLRIRHMIDSPVKSEMRALLRMAVRSRQPGRKWRKGWTRERTYTRYVRPSFRRRLNPVFVEALMRWPSGWTDCGCSATELTLWLRHMRSFVCSLGTALPMSGQLALL